MKRGVILALLVSLACVSVVEAKSKKVAKTVKKEQSFVLPQVTEPVKFSMALIEGDHFDMNYRPMTLENAIRAIEKTTSLKKGEFETTTDFVNRQSSAFAEKFLDGLGLQDYLGFVTKVDKGPGFGVRYRFNADTSEVGLYIGGKLGKLNSRGAPDWQMGSLKEVTGLYLFDFDDKIIPRGNYEASNAYGATVTVTKIGRNITGIAAKRMKSLDYNKDGYVVRDSPSIIFSMENSRAEKELKQLKALFVIKAEDPYVVYDFSYIEPTRDSPEEISTSSKYIKAEILGIIIYSDISGEILGRIPANFGKTELN